jgi:hypothetical protein
MQNKYPCNYTIKPHYLNNLDSKLFINGMYTYIKKNNQQILKEEQIGYKNNGLCEQWINLGMKFDLRHGRDLPPTCSKPYASLSIDDSYQFGIIGSCMWSRVSKLIGLVWKEVEEHGSKLGFKWQWVRFRWRVSTWD